VNCARIITYMRARAVACALMVSALLAAAALPAVSATSTTVVTVDVPSATSIVNQCVAPPARQLGLVAPGTNATTATGTDVCRIEFSSSNDSSTLRIGQADATGSAMTGAPMTAAQGTFGNWYSAIAAGASANAWVADSGSSRSLDGGLTWGSGGGFTDGG
jgi:hypothetical protein